MPAALTQPTALERVLSRAPARPELHTLPTEGLVAHLMGGQVQDAPCAQTAALLPLAAKVAKVHGDHNPALHRLRALVQELYDALEPHVEHEEQVIFPALLDGQLTARAASEARESLSDDHQELASLLEQVREAADGFRVPDWACSSYAALLQRLAALEDTLLQRLHLEHHALLPRLRSA